MARRRKEDSQRRTYDALIHTLPRSVEVRPGDGDYVLINGTPLRVRWVGEGWLRDIRPVVTESPDRPDIVVARRMSPGARDALAEAGIGWVDETGAAEIVEGPIVVARSGRPTKAEQRIERWTPAVLAVTEALLKGTNATVAETGRATGLSTGSCTNALRYLTEQGFLVADAERGPSSARRIADFDLLLDAYAAAVADAPAAPSLKVGVTWRDPAVGLAEAGAKWDATSCDWVCTGAVAASVIAPYLTSVTTADVYVDANTITGLEAVAANAGLQPVEGGRLTLRPFPTVTSRRLSIRKERLRLAPWPRVYADLRLVGVRGEEAAEHLREVMYER